MGRKRKRKMKDKGNVGDCVDRISDLPEEIIQHILSSLKTKDAVRTSLLSRRWWNQWMSVTKLDFLEFGPNMSQRRSSFMDFVDRVLALREPLDLQLFALACEVLTDSSRIDSWVCNAVKHNVQHLLLLLHRIDEEPFELPHCLFTCPTIEKAFIISNILLLLPSTISFSNLKVLTFQHVVFPDDRSTQRLFSSLPVLEELTLDSCGWRNVKVVTIALPLLQKLEMKEMVSGVDNCQFFIIARNLKSFYYGGMLSNDYLLYDTVSLCRVSLGLSGKGDIEQSGRQRQVAFRADRLLRGVSSSVKELMLSPYALEVLTNVEELYVCMPVLCKLNSLGVLPMGPGIDFGGRTLAKFLRKTPFLELLIFQSEIYSSSNHEDGNQILDPVPSCFSSHLKLITISRFCGTNGEMQVVKILLEKAEMLLGMYITCDREKFSGGSLREGSVLKQLQMLPIASEYCTIKFC